ncbi:hypothetical protein ES703_49556 [subsurface metagenome]
MYCLSLTPESAEDNRSEFLYICPEANKPHVNTYGGFLCGDCPHATPHKHVEKCDILCWEENDFCRPVPESIT